MTKQKNRPYVPTVDIAEFAITSGLKEYEEMAIQTLEVSETKKESVLV